MRLRTFLALALCALLQAAPPVVFISADGLGADQFTAQSMPKLWALAQAGRRGEGLPPFPATTFNGHVTLATGCWPGHHGVVANSYREPSTGVLVPVAHHVEHIQREPLWVAATRSGVRTAVYHWVGATGPWEGVTPWRLVPFAGLRPDAEALAFTETALQDGAGLVMTYLEGTDEPGHMNGPRSAEVRAKLARMDAELGPWLQRLQTTHPGLRVILTADHGMQAMTKRIHLPTLLDRIPCELVTHGGSAYVYLKDPADATKALQRLRKAGVKAWTRDAAPASLGLAGNPRVGDLVLIAPRPEQWFSKARSSQEEAYEYAGRVGGHAAPPGTPAMRTWLVVLGAGHGPLGRVPLWDLAPTVANWLCITWINPTDGKPISVISD